MMKLLQRLGSLATLATFQMLRSCVCLVAAVLGSRDMHHFPLPPPSVQLTIQGKKGHAGGTEK